MHAAGERFSVPSRNLVPTPSETWFRGMSVGGSFRRVSGRAHPREMQPTGCLRDPPGRLRRGDGIPQVRASSELQFGALREMAARERQGALSWRACWHSIGWVRYCIRFDEVGGQLDRRRARTVLNPCARESKVRTASFLREKLISDHGRFPSYEGQQGAANGQDSWIFFRNAHGFGRLDVGSRAGFTSSRPPPPWTSVFHFSV